MDDTTERRLRDADPLLRRTTDESRDQDWLRDTAASAASQPPRSKRPRGVVLVAAAAAVVLAAAAGGFLLRGGDEPAGTATDTPDVAPPSVTDLALPPNDSMGMCLAFSVEELAKAPVAFGGAVTEMAGDEVLVDVERWYRGGDSDQVRLTAPDTSMTSLGYSIDFEVGSRYLISAYDGVVNICGFSGPWTQEMGDAYAEAFGG
jgi:hypothetical protein